MIKNCPPQEFTREELVLMFDALCGLIDLRSAIANPKQLKESESYNNERINLKDKISKFLYP